MPLTVPTEFEKQQFNTNQSRVVLIEVGLGTGASDPIMYFSNRPLSDIQGYDTVSDVVFGDVVVHPIVANISGIRGGFDPLRKTWTRNEVKVSLLEEEFVYDLTTTDHVRPSHYFDDAVIGSGIRILLGVGGVVTDLDDMLLRFDGVLASAPVIANGQLSFTAIDKSVLYRKVLPVTTVGTIYSDAPEASLNRKIPIVYGEFEHDLTLPDTEAKGLARTELIDPGVRKYVVSDHIVEAITWLILDGYVTLGQATQRSKDEDDSGRGTVAHASDAGAYKLEWDFTVSNDVDDAFQNDRTNNPVINGANAYDGATGTYATVNDNEIDDGVADMSAYAVWQIVDSEGLRALLDDANLSALVVVHYYDVDWLGTFPDTDLAHVVWIVGLSGQASKNFGSVTLGAASWNNTGTTDAATLTDTMPLGVQFDFADIPTTQGDGVVNNQAFFKVTEIFVRVTGNNIYQNGRAWVAMQGVEDNGSYLDEPSLIVKDMLTRFLGVPSGDVIGANFDGATPDTEMRVNIHSDNEADSDTWIRQIMEQSFYAFCYNALSQPKCIPLKGLSVTADRVIPWSWVMNGSVTLRKMPVHANNLTIFSRYLQERGRYIDELGWDQSGDVDIHRTLRWPNVVGSISDTTVSDLAQFYVHSSGTEKGLWRLEQYVIEFETLGFVCADLDLGDWINLDDVTWDHHVKAFGNSWSGRDLLVIGLNQKEDATWIQAIELWP